jgi:5S rRNA maturation endonuclease (ribonuclease M5)
MNLLKHYEETSKKIQQSDIELTDELKRMVMSSCDVRGILESWNVRPMLIHGNQWKGYCPDHVLHDGHAQHLPKWFMSAETGDCMCFTSSKASNFIYIAKRMWRLDTIEETIKALTNGEKLILPPPEFVLNEEVEDIRIGNEQKKEEELKKGIEMVNNLLKRGGLSDKCLEYFANDGITKDTLDFLGVCSMEHGYLEGRAIIPFLNEKHEICGYIAVNYMGKEWWVKKQYDKMKKIDSAVKIESIEKSYRKTLYCPGFTSRNHLYGLYEVLNGGENMENLVVVEGERDAIKLLQEGIDCVSVHGTSLKDEQKTMIKKINPRRLYLGFDMDKAGNEATEKAYNALIGEVEDLYVLNFPENQDPKKFNYNELNELITYTTNNRVRERII